MQDETVAKRMRSAWMKSVKDKSEDSKIYSFLRSKINEEAPKTKDDDISDYVACRALAKAKMKSEALMKAIENSPAAGTAVARIQKEIAIIDEFLPQPATEEEVDIKISEAFASLEAQGLPPFSDSVMKILAPTLAGRYPAHMAKAKVQVELVDRL